MTTQESIWFRLENYLLRLLRETKELKQEVHKERENLSINKNKKRSP
jgi:hypothetical protein